jgi:hypothetical protein
VDRRSEDKAGVLRAPGRASAHQDPKMPACGWTVVLMNGRTPLPPLGGQGRCGQAGAAMVVAVFMPRVLHGWVLEREVDNNRPSDRGQALELSFSSALLRLILLVGL